mmetsp:Transcript_28654/g.62720  ORF Transcript_28654/g.62720 Transcript_28654/m.62720 type:complete len:248 (+) Transcript_28654:1363-2106(+)
MRRVYAGDLEAGGLVGEFGHGGDDRLQVGQDFKVARARVPVRQLCMRRFELGEDVEQDVLELGEVVGRADVLSEQREGRVVELRLEPHHEVAHRRHIERLRVDVDRQNRNAATLGEEQLEQAPRPREDALGSEEHQHVRALDAVGEEVAQVRESRAVEVDRTAQHLAERVVQESSVCCAFSLVVGEKCCVAGFQPPREDGRVHGAGRVLVLYLPRSFDQVCLESEEGQQRRDDGCGQGEHNDSHFIV